MNRLIWMIKQLLPLTYRSKYKEKDKSYFTVWKMWLGKCYDIDKVEIV